MSKSEVTVLTGWVEHTSQRETGFTVTEFHPGGDPHQEAIVAAVLQSYPTPPDLDTQLHDLAAAVTKVTLLQSGENFIGGSIVTVAEGTLHAGRGGGIVLLPKGARKNGWRLKPDSVFDVRVGYGHTAEITEAVEAERAKYPQLIPLTGERLAELPADSHGTDDDPTVCTLAVFGTWRLPDCTCAGAVWLLHSYDPDDDIAEGVLLVDNGPMTSEHGTVYGRDLLRIGGEIVGFEPVTLAAAIDLCDFDHDQIVAGLVAQQAVAVA